MSKTIAVTMCCTALLVSGADAKSQAEGICLKALAPVEAHAIPLAKGFEAVPCAGADTDRSAFRYDRGLHVSRAARPIRTSEIVHAYPEFGDDGVVPGQILHLVAMSGAIRVERAVEALQPARLGQRLFVKLPDGEILSVVYERNAR